ncbi:hypothetical protein VF21_10254 [Pseudogymnoascus sp. 05NY08]|nr:hypothetical protein VF21_10254 [Pseudogymnoascus sp. 05NY08]
MTANSIDGPTERLRSLDAPRKEPQSDQIEDANGLEHDNLPGYVDPFGDEAGVEVKYKTMAWWQCGMIMVAETVSLGILSLPSAVAQLGLVPAVILIVGLGVLATYTGYVIGQFKLRYPFVHSMADAGEILMGRFGRELLGSAQLLFLVFIMGSHILTFTVMMNTVTDHGTCSIVFGIVGLIVSLIGALPRTLKKVSYMAVVSGHVAFFSFISEMHTPTDYPKTLFFLQGIDTSMYTLTAIVIYVYAGKDVASPALGSTGPILSKVAYGIAIPTIVIAGVINGHVACKYVYVRIFRGSRRMHQRSLLAVGSWVGIAVLLWTIAWIIAEAIPVFNNLLSLIVDGSLCQLVHL